MSSNVYTRDMLSRVELLDGLRFVAALAVLLFHLGFRAWNYSAPGIVEYPYLGHVAKYGCLGVDLFFMISGFVILMTASKGGAASFLLSRIVRLYPAYWFCVGTTFSFLAYWHWGALDSLPLRNLLLNLTMFQSVFGVPHIDGAYWTLVVELRFYALILLVLWAGQIARIELILGVWLMASIAADFLPSLVAVSDIYAADWSHYFVAGALAYQMRIKGFSLFRLSFFGLAFVQAARHAHWYMFLKQKLTTVAYDPYIVQLIIALMFGFFLVLATGRLQIRHASLRIMGALTYPLYLIHGTIGTTVLLTLVQQYSLNRWSALLLVAVASLIAAWFIQLYIESKFGPRLRSVLAPIFLRIPSGAER